MATLIQQHGDLKFPTKQPKPLEAEFFDAARAKALLATKNRYNRPFKERKIQQYSRDMTAGNWTPRSGSPVGFDAKGNLLNGQNRLEAVVRTGKGQWFYVAYNATPEEVLNMDNGAARTNEDQYIMDEKLDGHEAPANMRVQFATLNTVNRIVNAGSLSSGVLKPAYSEMRTLLDRYGEELTTILTILSTAKNRRVKTTNIKGALVAGYIKYPEKAKEFATKLATGSFTLRQEPAMHGYREYVVDTRNANTGENGTKDILARTLSALHNYIVGDVETQIRKPGPKQEQELLKFFGA